ncbi:Uncharacterised protein [Yersinia aleksiciae]|uniref:Uncharacterized protein n=1 Tax=Yersinia aleksiciae TaxID=263819 RepID=A0A0T9UFW1_YERAE|nr:Uncharacterised protein [Yersinia aleksiciae]CNL39088.1 Uncharacterised protein [Yersinia aleksiciae]
MSFSNNGNVIFIKKDRPISITPKESAISMKEPFCHY